MYAAKTLDTMDALNRILDIATAFWKSQTFFTACQLGVFEALGTGPATAADLAQRLGLNPLACRRLLLPLRELGLVEQEEDRFQNSALGSFCTSTSTVPLEAVSMWGVGTPFYHMWEFLPDAIRELSPRWHQVLGDAPEKAFGALYADPKRLRRFTEWLSAFGTPQGQLLADIVDFSTHHCILDVAGGPGSIAIQIGLKHRHVKGIVMDMAPVCAIAHEHIHHNGLNEDYSGARMDDLMQDLHMLLVSRPGARERTETEYASLLQTAGFVGVEVQRLAAPRDLILARKT